MINSNSRVALRELSLEFSLVLTVHTYISSWLNMIIIDFYSCRRNIEC